MQRSRYLTVVTAVIMLGGLGVPAASAHPDRVAAGSAVVFQTEEEGLLTDLGLIAAKRGWTLEQAQAHHAISEAFGPIRELIATQRPELFAGATLSRTPGGPPTLYLTGRADDFVRGLLASAGTPVVVVEDRPFSRTELNARANRLNDQLAVLGFRDVVTAFDQSTSRVSADLTRVPGLPATAEDVLAMLPADLRDGVTLLLSDTAVSRRFSAFGGMRVRDDGAFECTSGWSVRDANGLSGVTTAGHCAGINEINHPGHGVHTLAFEGQHLGWWGDVEWHTSTQAEPDDFYADATSVRDVDSVEPWGQIMEDDTVCGYGRASDHRDCDLVRFEVLNCAGVESLVGMDTAETFTNGDSGGGWSFNNRAFGSHVGQCRVNGVWRNVWSVAALYDEALGVTVRTV